MPVGTLPGDKSPGIAGLLSFLIPGVGQMYAGQVGRGVAWLACYWSAAVVTIILSLVVVGLLLVPVVIGLYIWCIVDAVTCADAENKRRTATASVSLSAVAVGRDPRVPRSADATMVAPPPGAATAPPRERQQGDVLDQQMLS
jgi:TM2 domain-containing membrane protein YozV